MVNGDTLGVRRGGGRCVVVVVPVAVGGGVGRSIVRGVVAGVGVAGVLLLAVAWM